MHSRWRILYRWYQDHRAGVHDLLALMIACMLLAGVCFFTPLPALLQASMGDRLDGLVLWLAASWGLLAVFAWRRWCDVSRLLEAAETDPLTGLENRRKILRVLAQEFDRAVRYGRPLSVIIFDIDHFKRVNDSFGHPVGDEVLRAVARRITRKMRASDHFARWGGEEFILLCPETEESAAIRIAQRMRRAIKHRRVGLAGHVTASFGVCAHRGEADYEQLIEQADQYLYLAKEGGRDRVVGFYTATHPQASSPPSGMR